jgi:probable HAF family extracellular repeat protein
MLKACAILQNSSNMLLKGKVMKSQSIPVLAMAVLLFGSVPSAFATTASFQGLGDLAGGEFFSYAHGVSADGSTVVGMSESASGTEAFRWTSASGMVGLGDLAGGEFFSYAHGVSADGSTVVGMSESASGTEAFRWTSASGMVGLGDLAGGRFDSEARGVSADGSTVVGEGRSASGSEAFRWTDLNGNGLVDPNEKLDNHPEFGLGYLPGGSSSQAYGVSADGSTVVGYGYPGHEAFRWTSDSGMVALGDSTFSSFAYGVSADGSTVVGYGDLIPGLGLEAFRWTQATGMVGLGHLPGGGDWWSWAFDVSADGSTVVGMSDSDMYGGHSQAFRWTDLNGNGLVDLNEKLDNHPEFGLGHLPGCDTSWAYGVSADGSTVVGRSSNKVFIWDTVNGMRSIRDMLVNDYGLDLTGWKLYEAWGVSENGSTIVGYGLNPDGYQEAWIATIPNVCYVDGATGDNGNDGLTWETAFATIQKGIDDACDGDRVIVADGVYTGQGNRDLDFLGKAITVRSANGQGDCIIDCNGTEIEPHRGFYFHSGEGTYSILEGFTIKNGYAYDGGGVYCNSASPTITNCNFIDCSAENWGGGVQCWNSSATIEYCSFTGNSAEKWGGGVQCWNSSATIKYCSFTGNSAFEGGAITTRSNYFGAVYITTIHHCHIYGNIASGSGGGINSDCFSTPIISNCLITGNYAGTYGGGGISIFQSNPLIINCTIVDNTTGNEGGGILHWYGYENGSTLENCIIRDNDPFLGQITLKHYSPEMTINYCDIEGGLAGILVSEATLNWGAGNIDVDPCFADADANDFHLQSSAGRWDPNSESWITDANTSACIDSGNPGCPPVNESLPNGSRINMGAFGGTYQASMSPHNWALLGDLNNDGTVDFADFAGQVEDWSATANNQPGDLNRDGTVNMEDLVALVRDWLAATNWAE